MKNVLLALLSAFAIGAQAGNLLAIHNFPPAKLFRVDVATMNIMQEHDLPVPGDGPPRIAGALDQVTNKWYVSTATKTSPTPHLTQYDAHNLNPVRSYPMSRGAIMAMEFAHSTLWALGFNETQHEDDGVPSFMRVDLVNNHLATICQGRDDLSYGKASTVDEGNWLWFAQFYDPWTAFLDPSLGTCDLRSGITSWVRLGSQVQALLAVPAAFFGNNTEPIPQSVRGTAMAVLVAIQQQLIVTVDPKTGVFAAVVRLPNPVVYPCLSLGPQKQVYLVYSDTNLAVRSLVTINLAAKTVSAPISHNNLHGEDFEFVVFDSNP